MKKYLFPLAAAAAGIALGAFINRCPAPSAHAARLDVDVWPLPDAGEAGKRWGK